MEKRTVTGLAGGGLGLLALLAVACAPAPEPTATAASPTATTAPAAPTATTAAVAPTVAVVEEVKLRPIPVNTTPLPNPKAQRGGVFRSVGNTYPPDFSVWEAASGGIINGTAPRNDTLLEYNAWEAGKGEQLLPNLAYDWYTDASGEKWTFKLREGVTFHDGHPFTCADAEFMLETIKDSRDATGAELRASPRALYLSRVEDIRCADDFTLEVVTDGPKPGLPSTLALGNFVIMPRHVFQGNLKAMMDRLGPGVGPFKEASIIPGEGYSFVRNESYWNQPYPYLDKFEFTNLGSSAATSAAFRVGRAESGGGLTKEARQQLVQSGRARANTPVVRHAFDGLQANWKRDPWRDPRFSLAMRCALNSAMIISTALNGEAYESPIWALGELPGGSPWAITKEEWKAVHPCHGPTAETDMEQRVKIAQDLMKQLGFGPDNPARPDTFVWTPHSSLESSWLVVLDNFKKVYIEPKWMPLDTAKSYQRNYAGEFDINLWNFVTARFDPDTLLYEQYYSTSDRNYGKYINPELDALIELQSRTLDRAQRKALVNQIEKLLLRDNVKIWMYHGMDTSVYPAWMENYNPIEPGNQNTTSKLTRVWIDQAKKKALAGG